MPLPTVVLASAWGVGRWAQAQQAAWASAAGCWLLAGACTGGLQTPRMSHGGVSPVRPRPAELVRDAPDTMTTLSFSASVGPSVFSFGLTALNWSTCGALAVQGRAQGCPQDVLSTPGVGRPAAPSRCRSRPGARPPAAGARTMLMRARKFLMPEGRPLACDMLGAASLQPGWHCMQGRGGCRSVRGAAGDPCAQRRQNTAGWPSGVGEPLSLQAWQRHVCAACAACGHRARARLGRRPRACKGLLGNKSGGLQLLLSTCTAMLVR